MNINVWLTLFWASALLTVYVYIGYPAVLVITRLLRGSRRTVRSEGTPPVTLIISAFNEDRVIGEKLQNALALDYPPSQLEILVVSDSSTDQTDAIVASFANKGVRLLRLSERGGKTLGLNAAVRETRGEIIVFSDANAMYAPDALRQLVGLFADPSIGAATGESRYVVGRDDPSTHSEATYWDYEIRLKTLESEVGSLVGGDGAIYAIRKHLYRAMDASDLSDFVNPLQIVAAGYRNVYAPGAVSYESGATGFPAEFRRKVRIVNRAWRATWKMRRLLNPIRYGFFAIQFWSHKVLRWLVPVLLIMILIANGQIASHDAFYRISLATQLVCYSAALGGLVLHSIGWRSLRILDVPFYFCLVNAASLTGIAQALLGRRYTTWSSSRPGAGSANDGSNSPRSSDNSR
jgi:cellulose synthase/poly-beta-1,6-N-acetylglucosamine synthase-like glycosyltransferase